MSRSLRVLIVEDEYFIASFLAGLIEDWGHEVVSMCATGAEAIVHLKRGGIDLAVLDIKLRGNLTGVDVAETARAQEIAHAFLSGSGDPAARRAAEATNPLAFLQKPVNETQFKSILDLLIVECVRTQPVNEQVGVSGSKF